jgi:uncharacterized phiE125 gp8 family phage protein
MTIAVITPPAAIVDLTAAKAHLRVDHNDDDLLIEGYIAAASGAVDGPDGWLGRAVGRQTLELSEDAFYCANGRGLELPCPPVVSIDMVKYDDENGAEQTLASSAYRLTSRARLELISGASWPSLRAGSDALRIRYLAGYEVVPAPIVASVLLMTGDLYANRETGVVGTVSAEVKMSTTVEALLAPFRILLV